MVLHRVPQSGRIGGHHRHSTGVGLDDGQSPPLLGGGIHRHPGAVQPAHLLLMAHLAGEPDRFPDPQFPRQVLQRRTMVPLPDNDQPGCGQNGVHQRQRAQKVLDALVTLEPAEMTDQRLRAPLCGRDSIAVVVDRIGQQLDRGGDPQLPQLGPRALRDHREGGPAVNPQGQPLRPVDIAGRKQGGLQVDAAAEEVVHDGEQGFPHKAGGEEGDLVQVIDDHVERLPPAQAAIGGRDGEIEEIARAAADDPYAVDLLLGRRSGEGGAEESDRVAHRRNPAKDFVKMDLRPSGEGVADILPVDDQDAQGFHLAVLSAAAGLKPMAPISMTVLRCQGWRRSRARTRARIRPARGSAGGWSGSAIPTFLSASRPAR